MCLHCGSSLRLDFPPFYMNVENRHYIRLSLIKMSCTRYPVVSVIGFLKGKSAIAMARLCGKERNFTGEHLWACGYAVSTVGFELEQVRKYIR